MGAGRLFSIQCNSADHWCIDLEVMSKQDFIQPRRSGRVLRARRGFTLIELLVVVSIIAILIGILLPTLQAARARTIKVTCSANLRQIGLAVQMYKDHFKDVYPVARYMPPPFVSSDTDPPLPQTLEAYLIAADGSNPRTVYDCPGDNDVFRLCGSSYMYQSELSGQTLDQFFPVRLFHISASEVVVSRDFDGGTFDVTDGQIVVGPFHGVRNLLFADGHVGNFQ